MSGMGVKFIKPPRMSHTCGTSKPCQSAQTSEHEVRLFDQRENSVSMALTVWQNTEEKVDFCRAISI